MQYGPLAYRGGYAALNPYANPMTPLHWLGLVAVTVGAGIGIYTLIDRRKKKQAAATTAPATNPRYPRSVYGPAGYGYHRAA